jgi:hypothetical protein
MGLLEHAGRGAAWLARGVWDAEVAGSNPAAPTIDRRSAAFRRNVPIRTHDEREITTRHLGVVMQQSGGASTCGCLSDKYGV